MNYRKHLILGKLKKKFFYQPIFTILRLQIHEMSGISVTTLIINYFKNLLKQKYSIRAVFIPETIEPIVYLKKNLNKLKRM